MKRFKYPKLVLALCYSHDAWIVGSAANPECEELPRDFDVIVPFSEWQNAIHLIPRDATPNSFGGWKCISDGTEVDVWPGELGWLLKQARSRFAHHLSTNTHIVKAFV